MKHLPKTKAVLPKFFKRFSSTHYLAYILLALAIVFLGMGIFRRLGATHLGIFGFLVSDFYANLATEFISIVITILIIDTLNQRREDKRLKAQLIRELSGSDNGLTRRALKELAAQGWLDDGSLVGAYLWGANLEKANFGVGADLQNSQSGCANLKGAYILSANLNNAYFENADLQGIRLTYSTMKETRLWYTKLQGAELRYVRFQGANLGGAILKGADLSNASFEGASFFHEICGSTIFDEKTRLPDGMLWNSEVDVSRFTNPAHPDFWKPTKEIDDYSDVDEEKLQSRT